MAANATALRSLGRRAGGLGGTWRPHPDRLHHPVERPSLGFKLLVRLFNGLGIVSIPQQVNEGYMEVPSDGGIGYIPGGLWEEIEL